MDNAPLILCALLAPGDFAWLNALRTAHYPPERNRLPAHLTLFRQLPPSGEIEARRRLAQIAADTPPLRAIAERPALLGDAVVVPIICPPLDALREALIDDLHGLLGPADRTPSRLHVTIQNKVSPSAARATCRQLAAVVEPRAVNITGLGLYRYRGGPWEEVARWSLRGRPLLRR